MEWGTISKDDNSSQNHHTMVSYTNGNQCHNVLAQKCPLIRNFLLQFRILENHPLNPVFLSLCEKRKCVKKARGTISISGTDISLFLSYYRPLCTLLPPAERDLIYNVDMERRGLSTWWKWIFYWLAAATLSRRMTLAHFFQFKFSYTCMWGQYFH